jgi:hypothetical protein
VEHDFTSLAEAMPENKWNFRPTKGQFNGVRTFAEEIKHVACANTPISGNGYRYRYESDVRVADVSAQ